MLRITSSMSMMEAVKNSYCHKEIGTLMIEACTEKMGYAVLEIHPHEGKGFKFMVTIDDVDRALKAARLEREL